LHSQSKTTSYINRISEQQFCKSVRKAEKKQQNTCPLEECLRDFAVENFCCLFANLLPVENMVMLVEYLLRIGRCGGGNENHQNDFLTTTECSSSTTAGFFSTTGLNYTPARGSTMSNASTSGLKKRRASTSTTLSEHSAYPRTAETQKLQGYKLPEHDHDLLHGGQEADTELSTRRTSHRRSSFSV
ncbi:unnamed protein product, partial [Amoebophrya sp. A120]